MKINKTAYDLILNLVDPYDYKEKGGIIGGNNGITTEFVFDEGENDALGNYYPNVDKLNYLIDCWQNNGIEFYGIVHSHCSYEDFLSGEDKEYIKSIMRAMPDDVDRLYFPIVTKKRELTAYKASKRGGGAIVITNDIIIIGGN